MQNEYSVLNGLPPPPDFVGRQRLSPNALAGEGDPPHFWRGGPQTWRLLVKPKWVKTRGGNSVKVTHEVRWYLDRVKGVTTAKALSRIYDVLLHPSGWIRAGVHWRRVARREQADLILRVIPSAETVCGAGASGCFSWGYEADRKPVAEMGSEYIDNDPAWQVITGMEVCGHGTFAAEDMYDARHQPYLGVLGTWRSAASVGYQPTLSEIKHARQFIAGTIDQTLVHH